MNTPTTSGKKSTIMSMLTIAGAIVIAAVVIKGGEWGIKKVLKKS